MRFVRERSSSHHSPPSLCLGSEVTVSFSALTVAFRIPHEIGAAARFFDDCKQETLGFARFSAYARIFDFCRQCAKIP